MQVGHETTDASSGNNHFSQDNVMVMVMLRIWGSFWKKDSLITDIIFELQPIIIFSPVANFGDQSLL